MANLTNRIDRTLMLGGAEEWTLKSNLVSHPFHIHVNPFQIVKIIASDGKTDVSALGAVDDFGKDANGNPVIDPQYPGLKGVWKDTIFVKNLASGHPGQYTIVIRTATSAISATSCCIAIFSITRIKA